jgi:Spy/CpxP family protein refolding chaperone
MKSQPWLVGSLFLAMLIGAIPAVRGQAVVGQPGAGGYQISSNPLGQSLPFLWGPQMEKELDIVDTQREALTKIRTDATAKLRTLYDTSIPDQQERMKKYNEASKALGEETEKKVLEVLLPHQIKRLKQIALQMQLQQTGYGMSAAFQNSQVAEDLKITDEQKAQLVEKQKEVAKEMQEKTQAFYKQLQEESREKMLSVLTPAQRRKLEELTGERFQWQPWTPANPGQGGVQRIESQKK